jgi:hypothetical protein
LVPVGVNVRLVAVVVLDVRQLCWLVTVIEIMGHRCL